MHIATPSYPPPLTSEGKFLCCWFLVGKYHNTPNKYDHDFNYTKSVLQKLHLQWISFKYFAWYECNNLESTPSVLQNSEYTFHEQQPDLQDTFPEGILKYNMGTFPEDM